MHEIHSSSPLHHFPVFSHINYMHLHGNIQNFYLPLPNPSNTEKNIIALLRYFNCIP